MKDDRISNWFTTGTAALQPKEGTLFYEAVIEPRRTADPAGNEAAPKEPRPNLSLVREDEEREDEVDAEEAIVRDDAAALDAGVVMAADRAPALPDDDESDAWPWEAEVESSKEDLAEAGDPLVPQASSMEHVDIDWLRSTESTICREDDHSASEDVILCEPVGIFSVEEIVGTEEGAAEVATMPEAVEAASAYALRTVNTPKRIGSGQLVPARLTWRPGDPFGGDSAGKPRFRWEVMLTSACVTAACGLGCIWLLRNLLA